MGQIKVEIYPNFMSLLFSDLREETNLLMKRQYQYSGLNLLLI